MQRQPPATELVEARARRPAKPASLLESSELAGHGEFDVSAGVGTFAAVSKVLAVATVDEVVAEAANERVASIELDGADQPVVAVLAIGIALGAESDQVVARAAVDAAAVLGAADDRVVPVAPRDRTPPSRYWPPSTTIVSSPFRMQGLRDLLCLGGRRETMRSATPRAAWTEGTTSSFGEP